jgi:hypothetical protein
MAGDYIDEDQSSDTGVLETVEDWFGGLGEGLLILFFGAFIILVLLAYISHELDGAA